MIKATDICSEVPYLDSINISLKPGQITGIIGPNGAGKTTLLKILAGLIKPLTGEIDINGKSLSSMPVTKRATKISYLEQHSFVHWPLSVRQLINLGRFPHRENSENSPADDIRIVDTVIKQVGISQLEGRKFDSLSGGERARVIVARALAVQAGYLLADEPIASLDLKYQLEVMNILAQQARNNMAVCVILHDLNLAAAFCDCLYLLGNGKVVCHGTPVQVLTRNTIKATFDIDANVLITPDRIEINPVLASIK